MKVIVHNSSDLIALIKSVADKNEYPVTINIKSGVTRSLSQNALSHCIYSELSRYLIGKGRTDCNPGWVKQMLKYKFLGFEDVQYTDVVSGDVETVSQLRHTAELDRGEMLHYLTQIIEWSESIGCMIKIPVDSDYMKFLEGQNT